MGRQSLGRLRGSREPSAVNGVTIAVSALPEGDLRGGGRSHEPNAYSFAGVCQAQAVHQEKTEEVSPVLPARGFRQQPGLV